MKMINGRVEVLKIANEIEISDVAAIIYAKEESILEACCYNFSYNSLK